MLRLALALLLATIPHLAHAKEKKVPEIDSISEIKRGQTALLKSAKGMRYFLRVPKSYNPKRGARVIVFLHGSSMNGLQYLRSIEAKRWCPADVLICPNGEKGDSAYGANNFTFGSAPFVAGVTEEVLKVIRARRVYIGGHSQGGFVTYSVIMNYPDLFHGAFPMAGDCWMQNEPNLWAEKPAILAKQKQIAIAVIHGRSDPVVKFSQGQHAYDVFAVMGYPRLRLFAPERLGHQFMLSPVGEAIEWLDAMVGDDPKKCLSMAAKFAAKKEWGFAFQAAKRARELTSSKSVARKAASVHKRVEKVAVKEVKRLDKLMTEKPPAEWLPEWWAFRVQFGETKAAAKLVKKFVADRASQRAEGEQLFAAARAHFRAKDREEGHKILRELLKKAPASYEAYYAVTWLDDKD